MVRKSRLTYAEKKNISFNHGGCIMNNTNHKYTYICLVIIIGLMVLSISVFLYSKIKKISCPEFINNAYRVDVHIYDSLRINGFDVSLNRDEDSETMEEIECIFKYTEYDLSHKFYGKKGRNTKLVFYDKNDMILGQVIIHNSALIKIDSLFYYPQQEIDFMVLYELKHM